MDALELKKNAQRGACAHAQLSRYVISHGYESILAKY